MPAPENTLDLTAFVKGEAVRDLTAEGRVYILIRVFTQGTPPLEMSSHYRKILIRYFSRPLWKTSPKKRKVSASVWL